MTQFIYIFFLMILCHIIDDFVLQPICLSKLKQKSYWESLITSHNIYNYDYLCALIIHALSWSIMIMLPWIIFNVQINPMSFICIILINAIIHAIVDNEKANNLKINLIQDQTIHFLQILITFIYLVNY